MSNKVCWCTHLGTAPTESATFARSQPGAVLQCFILAKYTALYCIAVPCNVCVNNCIFQIAHYNAVYEVQNNIITIMLF